MQDFHQGLDTITKRVLSLVEKKLTPVILIDGRAASGKSSLAKELKNRLFKELEQAPRVIHMDDLYPGWEGLEAGSHYLVRQILSPLAKGEIAHWQIWNWEQSKRGNPAEPGDGHREFEGGTPLIVEGCGALSRASSELADLRIFLEADDQLRKQRWQERDQGRFDDYWAIWAAQEDVFYQQEKSESLAEIRLTS
ncbi:ATP-binding protein [Aquiluna borgnonia]|uniref:ATP-binding protein n=1 Tax=Aquiluna borgnonia TaxID=2499157 RepID=A0A7D4UHX1_9MICO|nr:ATP-binding protein [Aquiluna borgnonia]QKJ24740.1 ATP-binding protein [Aquiluna borgnonia]